MAGKGQEASNNVRDKKWYHRSERNPGISVNITCLAKKDWPKRKCCSLLMVILVITQIAKKL